jgi:ribosomal protein S18 acetylase RimI-like enzyme
MTDAIIIRRAAEEDFAPLCALYCKSVHCNPDGFIQDLSYHGCLIAKTRDWRRGGGDMLAAYIGGVFVAMGGLCPHPGGGIELCKLHVDDAWQGRGLGRLMTDRLIELARKRGFSEVTLHVTTTQHAAINLYRSIGFQPVKREVFETEVFGKAASFDTLHMHSSLADHGLFQVA